MTAAVPGPNDEMVLEVAINGRADALVTYNVADFAGPRSGLGFLCCVRATCLVIFRISSLSRMVIRRDSRTPNRHLGSAGVEGLAGSTRILLEDSLGL